MAKPDVIDTALEDLFKVYFSNQPKWGEEVLRSLPETARLKSLSAEDRAEAATRAIERTAEASRAWARSRIQITWKDPAYVGLHTYRFAASSLLASKLPLTREQLLRMLRAASSCGRQRTSYDFPLGRIASALERFAEGNEFGKELERAASRLERLLENNRYLARDKARFAAILRHAQQSGPSSSHETVTAKRPHTQEKSGGRSGPSRATSDAEHVRFAHSLLEEFVKTCPSCARPDTEPVAPVCRKLKKASPAVQVVFVLLALDRIASIARTCTLEGDQRFYHLVNFHHAANWTLGLSQCIAMILRRTLPLSDDDVLQMVEACNEYGAASTFCMPHLSSLCSLLEHRYRDGTPTAKLASAIHRMASMAATIGRAPEQRLSRRLVAVASGPRTLPIEGGEAWSDRALADLQGLSGEVFDAWRSLLEVSATAGSAEPTRKWTETATVALGTIGEARFVATVIPWFGLVNQPRTVPAIALYDGEPDPNLLLIDRHMDVLRGLCWACATVPDPTLSRALGKLAISAYRKVPGRGPRAVKVGNAAVYALGQMPGEAALGQLAMLRVRIKFGTAQKLIEKALAAKAERMGRPRKEIDELGVPSYGLTDVGVRTETMGEHTAELRVERSGACSLTIRRPDGKTQKSVPAAVKAAHSDDLKELKAAAKDIASMLAAQRNRIDSLFLDDKSWDAATWRERYFDHPLVGVLARRLIWRFAPPRDGAWNPAAEARSAIWFDGALLGPDGTPVEIDTDAVRVRLWHPIEAGTEETLAWRRFLDAREIVQPFKQAHREVYILTDAERATETYSNRYAAHVLRQHQFNALCAARNWRNTLRLLVDDEFPPASRTIRAHGLRAEFWVEGVGGDYGEDTNGSSVFNHVATDQVRFYPIEAAENRAHASGGAYSSGREHDATQPVPLERIPPLIFSEVMRDVDLFVGVTSVGNNPAWQDGGPDGRYRDYWWAYSFGELTATAESRRDILRTLLPRLRIGPVCELDGRFLKVRGTLRTYKIHLGSGNILMEPNDQYLCIVPGRGDPSIPQTLYLPFEGDRTLSVIISKAFLLAADNEIKDTTITRQIASL